MTAHRAAHDLLSSPFAMKDPGNAGTITPDRWGAVCPMESGATAQTRTLAQPTKPGMRCSLVLKTDGGGDVTVTVTGGYNADADTAIVFGDAGDWVEFASIDVGGSYYWRVASHEGTNLSTETLSVDSLTVGAIIAPTATAEHGAGVIGTGAAPVTTRWVENGHIITEIKVDLQGLASKNTANDVIGLAAGGNAYIGQNVVAKNGVIYKMELICLETPTGGDNDVNVVVNSSGTLAYDGAGGTTYGIDGGDAVAGQVVADLTQSLTANHYFYLTAGTGDTADTYTAGQFIVRMYGHPVLT